MPWPTSEDSPARAKATGPSAAWSFGGRTFPPTDAHREALAALGVEGSPQAALGQYLDLVARWSERLNLTAARSPEQRARTLVLDAWRSREWVEGPDLLDVGSGSGSPGLVLALLRPELRVTLLEPRQKRWAFLREACRVVDRSDIRVEARRHDEWTGPGAQTVTLRALSLPAAELSPLSAPGGRVIVIGRALSGAAFRPETGGPGDAIHLYRNVSENSPG